MLTKLFKSLRETIAKKIALRDGYKKPKSLFLNTSEDKYGKYLPNIAHIAFKMIFSDYVGTIPSFNGIMMSRIENQGMEEFVNAKRKKGDNCIDAILEFFDMPHTKKIRSIASQSLEKLVHFRFCLDRLNNLDDTFALYEITYGVLTDSSKWALIDFLLDKYPIRSILSFIQRETYLNDCVRMLNGLSDENRDLLILQRPRLREMHDWLMFAERSQCATNYNLNVPEHIVKRLAMQSDKLKFFLPSESFDLLKAGISLHNCVAGYSKQMLAQETFIVLVANEKGKLIAAVDVKDGAIVQAKIDKNICVRTNHQINLEVLAWAEKCKLAIKTDDIDKLRKIKKSKAA